MLAYIYLLAVYVDNQMTFWPVAEHCHCSSRMASSDVLTGLDETQVKLLEEECILIDNEDCNIGAASKKVCHNLDNINKGLVYTYDTTYIN